MKLLSAGCEYEGRIMRRIDPETNIRAEFGNFERGGKVQGATMQYDMIQREAMKNED